MTAYLSFSSERYRFVYSFIPPTICIIFKISSNCLKNTTRKLLFESQYTCAGFHLSYFMFIRQTIRTVKKCLWKCHFSGRLNDDVFKLINVAITNRWYLMENSNMKFYDFYTKLRKTLDKIHFFMDAL
jgi:hypothetical protein